MKTQICCYRYMYELDGPKQIMVHMSVTIVQALLIIIIIKTPSNSLIIYIRNVLKDV